MKKLVVYFSAEKGNTAKLAERMAKVSGADLFEIKPSVPYTVQDLNYLNPLSRVNKEKIGKKDVGISAFPVQFDEYDEVYIGFPIWYACAPNVVNSFCGALDFAGKKVYVFATSGGSGIGKTAEKLAPYVKGADIVKAAVFGKVDDAELESWMK